MLLLKIKCVTIKLIIMKNTELLTLSKSDLEKTLGGGCSFAYDLGFGLRVLGHLAQPLGVLWLPGDVALYKYHCS